MAFLHTYHCQYFNTPTLRSKNFWYTKTLPKTLLSCVVTKIGSEVGAYVIYEKNVLILLISSQKLYFGDDDAIYDTRFQEPVWKWRHYYRKRNALHFWGRNALYALASFSIFPIFGYPHMTNRPFVYPRYGKMRIEVCLI